MTEADTQNPGATPTMVANQMVADFFAKRFPVAGAEPAVPAQPPVPQAPAPVAPVAPAPQSTSPVEAQPPPGQMPVATPAPQLPTQTQDVELTPPLENGSTAAEPTGQPAGPKTHEDRQAHAFAALRFENKQLNSKVSDYERQLREAQEKQDELARKNAEFEAQLASERETRAVLEDKVGRANLAESKEFRERFDARMDKAVEGLTKLISEKTDMTDPRRAEEFAKKLMTASEGDVLHTIENLPSYVQGAIYNFVRDGKAIQAEKETALEQWRVTQSGLSEAEARRQAEELNARRQAMAAEAVKSLRASKIPIYDISDPTFAEIRAKAESQAEAFVRTASESELAHAATEGVMAQLAYNIIDALVQENAQLKSRLSAGYRLDAPPARPSFAPPTPPPPKPAPELASTAKTSIGVANDVVSTLMRQWQK